MSQYLATSGVSGKFEFELEGLCITRDMLAALLGPVQRDENTSVGVRLPAVVEDSQTGPAGTDLVQVDGLVIEVDAVQSPPLILTSPGGQADRDPQAAELHDRLAKAASDTVRDFLTWVRLHLRQYWIAPDGPPVLRESLVYVTSSQDIIVRHEPSPGRPVPFARPRRFPGRQSRSAARSSPPAWIWCCPARRPGCRNGCCHRRSASCGPDTRTRRLPCSSQRWLAKPSEGRSARQGSRRAAGAARADHR